MGVDLQTLFWDLTHRRLGRHFGYLYSGQSRLHKLYRALERGIYDCAKELPRVQSDNGTR